VVQRKRRLATEGRRLHNEEKAYDLYYTGKTMKMYVTVKDRGTYLKERDAHRILVAKLEINN
jgi:hypothetical protein